MKIKLTLLLLFLVLALALNEYYQNKYSIKKTIETEKSLSFLVDKEFSLIRKSLVQGKFEEEILKINNATVLEKKWNDLNLYLERPLRKDRYWDLKGNMIAKIKINNDNTGKEEIEMNHNIEVGSSNVKILASLENPIEKIGLTTLEQEIKLEPGQQNKTIANVRIKMKVKRMIPSVMEKYAQEKLDSAANDYIEKTKHIIESMPETKTGIFIQFK